VEIDVMAKINVTPDEFCDIVVSFLFDKMLHPDEIVPNNIEFNDLMESMRGKGLRSLFMNYYLSMDSNTRVKYKKIKNIFDGSNMTSVINIVPERIKVKPEKEKKILKKVIGQLLAHSELEDKEKEMLAEFSNLVDENFWDLVEVEEEE